MIASRQRQIASFEGVMNDFRREQAEAWGKLAPMRPKGTAEPRPHG